MAVRPESPGFWEEVAAVPGGEAVTACIQCNNRKGATPAEDFIRALYRDGFLNDGEFQQRVAMVAKLADGELKPDFSRALAP